MVSRDTPTIENLTVAPSQSDLKTFLLTPALANIDAAEHLPDFGPRADAFSLTVAPSIPNDLCT